MEKQRTIRDGDLHANAYIYENVTFRQQLLTDLQNENTINLKVENLVYREKPLVNYFKRYNSSFENIAQTITKNPEREIFNVKITGSINYSSLKFTRGGMSPQEYNFGSKYNWTAGLEFEYFMPFYKNKLSVVFIPTFEHYKNSLFIERDYISKIDMKTVHFPLGIRYNMYLKNDIRFFISGFSNPNYYINKNRGFAVGTFYTHEISESANWIFSGGFIYKKWMIDFRYNTYRDILNTYLGWNSYYPKKSISVSYKLFNIRK